MSDWVIVKRKGNKVRYFNTKTAVWTGWMRETDG
jgi:hypothetical protein